VRNALFFSGQNATFKKLLDAASVFLMTVWVMDELPVDLLGLLRGEFLLAYVTLELSIQLDSNVLDASITRLCGL